MTTEEFFKLYAASSGWEKPVNTDENLCPDYPAALYDFSGNRVLNLCPEMEEWADALSPDMSLETVLSTLYTLEKVTVKPERVLGFYADSPISGEELPDLTDALALKRFLSALTIKERVMGGVTVEDDFTCVLTHCGRIVAAAGAVCDGRLADVSVCVARKQRGKGYGSRVVAALCKKIQAAGYLPVYRAEESNLPSVKLAQHLRLRQGFIMEGALLTFPDAGESI